MSMRQYPAGRGRALITVPDEAVRQCERRYCTLRPVGGTLTLDEDTGQATVGTVCEDGHARVYRWRVTRAEYRAEFGHDMPS